MENNLYDVIVAGAGPAGASAAYFLGERGLKVLVLEKEHLPRYKTCGGGLSTDFLAQQFPFSFEPVIQSHVQEMMYAYLGQVVSIPARPDTVAMVMRDQFDKFILDHAKVDLLQGVAIRKVVETDDRISVETGDGRAFSARYLVGADGANSVVAHQLGLRRKKVLAAAIEVEAAVSPQVFRRFKDRPVFIFGKIRKGYLWIFPKRDHLSVGIASVRPRHGELQATLKRVMAKYSIPVDEAAFHGHPIPLFTRLDKIATRRALLAGDAAGLVDPISGEGIRFAIKSGRLAAEAILAGQVERYPATVRRQIGRNHRGALFAARIFYHLPILCVALGAPNPFTTRAIEDLLSDRGSSLQVMLLSFFSLPVFLLTELAATLAGLFGGPRRREALRRAVYLGKEP